MLAEICGRCEGRPLAAPATVLVLAVTAPVVQLSLLEAF